MSLIKNSAEILEIIKKIDNPLAVLILTVVVFFIAFRKFTTSEYVTAGKETISAMEKLNAALEKALEELEEKHNKLIKENDKLKKELEKIKNKKR